MSASISLLSRAKAGDASRTGYLSGQFLIAMPHLPDTRFQRTVIYLCAHSEEGAMGLIVNKVLDSLTLPELVAQLDIPTEGSKPEKVHFGGPVDTSRGFVLHSCDYIETGTVVVGHGLALTATIEILRAITRGDGPQQWLVALGYANWGPGQLDAELQANAWLSGPPDETLLFDPADEAKWERAIKLIGIDLSMLSSEAGHA
jgi:putative transcriptional regulator